MESLIQALLIWIASNSRYSVDDIPTPTVLFLTPQEITAEYYGDHTDLIPDNGIDDRVLALYDATAGDNGAIYLRRVKNNLAPVRIGTQVNIHAEFSLPSPTSDPEIFRDDPILTERLLHELVHHVQFHSGEIENFPCRAHGEIEAYALGGLYFKKRYIEDPMPNRNFWAHVYSRC